MLTESRQRIGRVRGSSALTGQAIAGDGDDDDDYDENVCSHIFSLTIDPSNTYYRRYSFTLLFLGCLSCFLLITDVSIQDAEWSSQSFQVFPACFSVAGGLLAQ